MLTDDEFCLKMMKSALKMMNSALKLMNFVFKREFAPAVAVELPERGAVSLSTQHHLQVGTDNILTAILTSILTTMRFTSSVFQQSSPQLE